MRNTMGKISDINIAYIGGGSRGWAWTLMSDLANEPEMSGNVKLYDIDFQAAKNNEVIGNKYTQAEKAVGKWNYRAVESLEEALKDADFVIISILPGTFKEMESDVHEPEKYGIYQSVGDTTGPGGMIRALRTIPMIAEIGTAIRSISPKAWVINYTNPMSLCIRTLYHVFPQIKAFGCCHEVFGTQKIIAEMCREVLGEQDVDNRIDRKDIHVNVLGINHFTWFDEVSYQGTDLIPVWKDYVNQHFEEGFQEENKHWANSSFECAHRVKFDLFHRYGYIAAAGDRHLAEFMPGDEYLKDPETVKAWRFGLTSVAWRMQDLENRLDKSRRLVKEEEAISLEVSGEEGTLLIKALLGKGRVISNANIPNYGQIANLPLGTIVETNAVFSKDSIKAVMAGKLPDHILELIQPHIRNQEYILQAAFEYRKDLVIVAFQNDPLVKAAALSWEQLETLVDTMLHNTKKYLPKGWRL
ncbi:MAG: alpha-glucosidase/alpha-galactosidase [Mobilitalea sp.]